jgi:hypothetical protein
MISALERIQKSVTRLAGGVDTPLPETLRDRLRRHERLDEFAKHFDLVVDAELSRAYHRFGHGKATKQSKAYFHKREADLASELISLAHPMIDVSAWPSGPLGPYDPALVEQARQAVEENGCFVWPHRLDDALVDEIVDVLSRTPFIERGTKTRLDGYRADPAQQHNANVADVASDQALIEKELFQRFIVDPTMVDAVQQLLKACPVHTALLSWWSVGSTFDEKILSQAAQMYHQDKDWIKWYKVLIYLTDVDEETGPHVYVEGSHRDYQDRFLSK